MKKIEDSKALKLEKVLGISSQSGSSMSEANGDLYYVAGSVVVRYNSLDNSQKGFYNVSKAISCLAASPNGKFLAIGEKGHNPSITIWDIERHQKIQTLSG